MINAVSAIIMVILLLFTWALLKTGSDYDDQWEDYEDVY
jgi:hypothetical protein